MNISIRLSKPHRWGLYVVWAILSITGLYFAYIQDWQMQEPTEWTVNILKLHGISAAFMLLFVCPIIFACPTFIKQKKKCDKWINDPLLYVYLNIFRNRIILQPRRLA